MQCRKALADGLQLGWHLSSITHTLAFTDAFTDALADGLQLEWHLCSSKHTMELAFTHYVIN